LVLVFALGNGFAYVAGFHGGRLACFVVNEGSLLIHTDNVVSMTSPHLTVLGWLIWATYLLRKLAHFLTVFCANLRT
jgi:hypothetical protein